jgi:hypothetical protein
LLDVQEIASVICVCPFQRVMLSSLCLLQARVR